MTRDSSNRSIYKEIALDIKESELSDSLTKRVDLPEALEEPINGITPTNTDRKGILVDLPKALEEAIDGITPTHIDRKGKSSIKSKKKLKKGWKNKGKEFNLSSLKIQ